MFALCFPMDPVGFIYWQCCCCKSWRRNYSSVSQFHFLLHIDTLVAVKLVLSLGEIFTPLLITAMQFTFPPVVSPHPCQWLRDTKCLPHSLPTLILSQGLSPNLGPIESARLDGQQVHRFSCLHLPCIQITSVH